MLYERSMIRAHISKLTFSSGLKVALRADSVLVILGPNNSGKTATLADIRSFLRRSADHHLVLRDLQLDRSSELADIKALIQEFRDANGSYSLPGFSFHENNLSSWWTEESRTVGPFLSGQLLSDLTTRTRLADCDPPPAFDARNHFNASHPFQYMYRNPELEAKTSAVFRRAFKQDLVLHRASGTTIPVYVGDRPALKPGEDRISLSFLERVEKLSRLEQQGDGIRSFVSIVARVLTEDRSIQLIDEPEAFLHPPQARLVSECVASHGGGRQTIIATHSSDVVQGLLSSHADRVSVVRLSRKDGPPTASYLPTGKVAELWKDPILRFSNILDGLFHEGVIVTESDADCRFYEALANVSVPGERRPDLHYTYSGGKDRLPVVVAALAGLKVPTATVVDFDVLNNDQPLARIVEAHGGDWSAIESDWKAVRDAVEVKEAFLGGDQFRGDVTAQLRSYPNAVAVPKEVLREIRKLTRRASPWDNIKDAGLAAIAKGESTVTASRLLATLRGLGIFVVPQGEMEGFCRSIGGHGPRWVEEALKRDLANDAELNDARSFISGIVAYLRSCQQ